MAHHFYCRSIGYQNSYMHIFQFDVRGFVHFDWIINVNANAEGRRQTMTNAPSVFDDCPRHLV